MHPCCVSCPAPPPLQDHGHNWHHTPNKWWCEFDRDDWVPEWKDKCKDHCPGECRPRKKEVGAEEALACACTLAER